jgi:UDP-glucose 4-epimerase
MCYAITGGAGFIGSHIAEEFVDRGNEAVIFDNLFSGKLENIAHLMNSITFVEGSFTDLPLLKEVFTGADGIFYQTTIASVPCSIRDPLATNVANVTGTLNIAIAAKDCGVKKIVYASSGDQRRDFTYVKDVVQANMKAKESGAEVGFKVATDKSEGACCKDHGDNKE